MKYLPHITLLATLAFAISPLLSTGFNGFEPAQFPIPQDDPPVQPAGYAFSIWGLIYLWLIASAAFGLLRRATSPGWQAMRPALILSLATGAFWIPLAQTSVIWATVLIFFMLAAALAALLMAGSEDRLWLREPIGLYAGWLTAASSVSIGLLLAGFGFIGPTIAALIALALALVIALTAIAVRPDTLGYSAGVVWALVGVIVSNLSPTNWPVLGLAAIGAIALIALTSRPTR